MDSLSKVILVIIGQGNGFLDSHKSARDSYKSVFLQIPNEYLDWHAIAKARIRKSHKIERFHMNEKSYLKVGIRIKIAVMRITGFAEFWF